MSEAELRSYLDSAVADAGLDPSTVQSVDIVTSNGRVTVTIVMDTPEDADLLASTINADKAPLVQTCDPDCKKAKAVANGAAARFVSVAALFVVCAMVLFA